MGAYGLSVKSRGPLTMYPPVLDRVLIKVTELGSRKVIYLRKIHLWFRLVFRDYSTDFEVQWRVGKVFFSTASIFQQIINFGHSMLPITFKTNDVQNYRYQLVFLANVRLG